MLRKRGLAVLPMLLLSILIVADTQLSSAYQQPLLKIKVSGYRLTAGDEKYIKISITNVGGEAAYDVKASLTVPSNLGIAVVEDSYKVFDRIEDGESKYMFPLLYVASNCPLGAYSLMLTLTYHDDSGILYTDSIQIGVVVDAVKPIKPVLTIDVEKYNVTAGVENKICITLTNIGEETVYDVKALLASATPGINILEKTRYLFNKIEADENVSFRPLLGISKNVALGTYPLSLTLEYRDSKGVPYRDELTISILVNSVFSFRLSFKAEVEEYRLKAGAENEVKIVLTNTGDVTVYNVDIRVSSTNPQITILKGIFYMFRAIKPNSSVYLTPTLGVSRTIPLGASSLTLTLKYEDPDGVSHVDNLAVGVLVDSIKPVDRTTVVVESLQITPSNIHPGDKLTVEIELKSLGAEAYDVSTQLIINPQEPFISLSPTLVFIGDLGVNQTAKARYNLQVSGDAEARPYTFQLTVSYYDLYGQPKGITEEISVVVSSIMNFRLLNVQPSVLTVEAGETVTLEADLLLIGTETARFVQVEVLGSYPFIQVSESYEYIGRVDPDNPVPFDVQFMVDSNATPGSYMLPIRVCYWNEYNQEREAVIKLPVTVSERVAEVEETASPTFWDIAWRVVRALLGIRP